MKEKKNKNEPFAVLKNGVYAIKTIFNASPLLIPALLVNNIIVWAFNSFVQDVLFLKYLLEYIEDGREYKDYMTLLLIFVAARVLCEVIDYSTDFYANIQYRKVYKKLGTIIFTQAQRVDIECFDNPKFYDTYKRASEIITKDYYVDFCDSFISVIAGCVTGALLISYLATVDVKVLLVLLSGVLLVVFESLKSKNTVARDKKMTPNERVKEYVQRVVFLRDYSKEMRTTNIYSVMFTRFVAAIKKNREIMKKFGVKSALYDLAGSLLGESLPQIATFTYATVSFVVKRSIGIADFSVMLTAVNNIKSAIDAICSLVPELVKSIMYFGNLCEFLKLEPKLAGGTLETQAPQEIEFRDVSFTYPGTDAAAISHLSFTVKGGQTVAVVGRNGAGKTTLVKLLLRFYNPDEGIILYNGIDLREYSVESLRKTIGTVFQNYKVFALTVGENVLCREVCDDSDDSLVHSALNKSGMLEKVDSLKDGVETVLTREFDENGVGLSGGEQQKCASARLFARGFELAVLDEPSSALDPIAEHKMFTSLLEATRGKTVIYISHRLSSAVLSDKIIMLEDGSVTETGTHESLLAKNGKYAAMFALQAANYGYDEEIAAAEVSI